MRGVEASALTLRGACALGKGAISLKPTLSAPITTLPRCLEIAMNLSAHLFRLQPAPTEQDQETIHVATRADVQSSKPLFRAPALPTAHQLNNELPFTANYRPRLRVRP